MDQIHRLTNLSEINRILHETIAKERAIDADLDKLLSKRVELERSFLLLNTPTAEMLELVHADSEQLLSSIQGTAALAEHISGKVRRLDCVQSRVKSALGKINLILDRTNCINGVQEAMEAEDYESAASHISTFMDLEERLAGSIHAVDVGQAESQRQILLEARTKLEEVVARRFDDAVNRRDGAAAVRFAKLYKPLGKESEGLQRFIEYLKLVVSGQARANYASLSEAADNNKTPDFVAALSLLFKDIGLALEEHEAFIRETYGSSAMLDVVTGLQAECDSHGNRIIARYREARRIDKLVKEISGHKRGTPLQTDASGLNDPRQVEALLEDVLRMCTLSEEYNSFMLAKMRNAMGTGKLSAARESNFRTGQFNVGVRELLSYYMALEEFYLDETSSMAVRIDEVIPGSLTSSMVDDVFFILRKCGLRALASGSVQVSCALLMEINNFLANQFRNILTSKLGASGATKLAALSPDAIGASAAAPSSMKETPGAGGSDYAVYLNNCDVSAEYVTKLRAEFDSYMGGGIDLFASASDKERAKSVISELAKTGLEFRQTVSKSLEQLGDALMPRIKQILDGEVAAANYLLSEADYASNEVEEGWTHRLLAAFGSALTWTMALLTVNNYESLLQVVLDKVLSRLEALMSRKQFNQLGGLQLDRDVRKLTSHLSELTSRTVRDKFAKLNQMAIILGLETVDEMLDYWGDAATHITWRLGVAEVRSILAQRSDFSKDAIMLLPLT